MAWTRFSVPWCIGLLIASVDASAVDYSASTTGRFLAWLRNNGAQLGDIAVSSSSPSGCPVFAHAQRGYTEGEVVFRLPKELLFTAGAVTLSLQAVESGAASPALGLGDEFSTDELLVVSLLNECAKEDDSFWAPWIATLPRRIPGHPFFYSAAELQGLSNTYAELELKNHGHAVVQKFKDKIANSTIIPAGYDTIQRIYWAFAIVWSRTVFLAGRDGKLHEFMAPVLCTPPPRHLGLRFANSNSVLEAISNDAIAPSEPLLFEPFAPEAPNAQLLLRHGRAWLNNSHDYLPLSFVNPTGDALFEFREKLFGALRVPLNHKLRVGSLPPGLYECAVVLTLNDDDAARVRKTNTGMDLSVANTTNALHQLYAALAAMLARYPHSRVEDEEALSSKNHTTGKPLSFNEQMILTVRIGEKTVLEDSIARVAAAITSGGRVQSGAGGFEEEVGVEDELWHDSGDDVELHSGEHVAKCTCMKVVVQKATKLPKGDQSGAFGLFGSADPFVKVLLGGKELGRTSVVPNSRSPEWRETGAGAVSLRTVCMDHTLLASTALALEVWDHDGHDEEEFLGRTPMGTVGGLCSKFEGAPSAPETTTEFLLSEEGGKLGKASITFSLEVEMAVHSNSL